MQAALVLLVVVDLFTVYMQIFMVNYLINWFSNISNTRKKPFELLSKFVFRLCGLASKHMITLVNDANLCETLYAVQIHNL